MKPVARIIGEDGNVFNICGIVVKSLRKARQFDKAKKFQEEVFKCHSYGDVLVTIQEYVEVK